MNRFAAAIIFRLLVIVTIVFVAAVCVAIARGEPAKLPGDSVAWYTVAASRPAEGRTPFLQDVTSHLPTQFGNTYHDADPATWCHETTHGINSYLRQVGKGAGVGFYVGGGRLAYVAPPRIRLGDVANAVPVALRSGRYYTYLVKQRGQWDADPLYVWDEWVAYTNGAKTAIESRQGGGNTDKAFACLELSTYALSVALACERLDSAHLANEQFKEFLAFELRRSLVTYRQGMVTPGLQWDKAADYERRVRTDADLGRILKRLYGDKLTWDILLGK